MTSSYHGIKISGSLQSFLTETTICIVERWENSLGYRFVPECNRSRESHACQFFFVFPTIFRLRVVPHFSSRIVEGAKRERA